MTRICTLLKVPRATGTCYSSNKWRTWQQYCNPDCDWQQAAASRSQHFILLFGAFEMFLSQPPDIHLLRWVNATCTTSTIGFAGSAIVFFLNRGKKLCPNLFIKKKRDAQLINRKLSKKLLQ
jgi:hypothetical protein